MEFAVATAKADPQAAWLQSALAPMDPPPPVSSELPVFARWEPGPAKGPVVQSANPPSRAGAIFQQKNACVVKL
jgi:hypothetical protein